MWGPRGDSCPYKGPLAPFNPSSIPHYHCCLLGWADLKGTHLEGSLAVSRTCRTYCCEPPPPLCMRIPVLPATPTGLPAENLLPIPLLWPCSPTRWAGCPGISEYAHTHNAHAVHKRTHRAPAPPRAPLPHGLQGAVPAHLPGHLLRGQGGERPAHRGCIVQLGLTQLQLRR